MRLKGPKQPKPGTITRQVAEEIGLKVLLHITRDEGRLSRFLADSGLDPSDLMARAGEPEMLAALIGHLLEDELQLLVFASNAGVEPADLHAARAQLGGAPTWDSM